MWGGVLPASSVSACRACLGPVSGYERCYGCHELFAKQGVSTRIEGRIVPMTSAVSPGLWYTWLQTYKAFHFERGIALATLAWAYLDTHATRIAGLLGGEATHYTIVASKRGHTFETQPFRRALARVPDLGTRLRELVRHRPDQTVARRRYTPNAFEALVGCDGARIVLLEDTWVTGATAVSAAGALLASGAESVAILPLARMVERDHWPPDHSYLLNAARPYDVQDPSNWPR